MALNHRIILVLVLLMSAMMTSLQAETLELETKQLGRQFGILAGDTVEHVYTINVPNNYQLAANTLPQKGPLNYWLDFVSAAYESTSDDGKQHYTLTLSYQVFYAPLDVRLLTIPPVVLVFSHGDEQLELTIPKSSFSVSPLKSIAPLDANQGFKMMPDIAPATMDTDGLVMRLIASSIGLVVLVIAWMIVNGLIFKRFKSPFLDAYRQIKRIACKKDPNSRDFHQALHATHHAFDITAKQTLFSHQIDEFLANFPQYIEQKQKISGFYSYSSTAIYHPAGRVTFDFDMLMALCKAMAKSEVLALKK